MVPHTIGAKEPWFWSFGGLLVRFPNGLQMLVAQFHSIGAGQSTAETVPGASTAERF